MKTTLIKTTILSCTLMLIIMQVSAQEAVKGIADNNNQFAFDLYRKVALKENGNIFISPFSISTALAMTYAGADGKTAEEMEKTLHYAPNTEAFHKNFGSYLLKLADNARGNIDWRVANRLWGDKKYTFVKEFLDLTDKAYNSPLQMMDFMGAAEACRNTINQWVEKNTENKIKNLIPEGGVSSDTRLVLTNAVYFKADWLYPFKKEKTKPDTFTKSDGSEIKVPFMNCTDNYAYAATDTYQAIRLPYKGEKHSMVVVLPKDTKKLSAVEKEFDSKGFTPLFSGYKPEVILSLPKFKTTLSLSLADYLKSMGMASAFKNGANFSKMSPTNDLCISEVFHKAFIEVDEKGTEAAAATAVVMMTTSCAPSKKDLPIVFKANRPYLFYIVDDETKAVLFMGRMMEPAIE